MMIDYIVIRKDEIRDDKPTQNIVAVSSNVGGPILYIFLAKVWSMIYYSTSKGTLL